jgi:hypothetical protein
LKSDLNRLRETFQRMEEDGFSTNLPLKWGFYFVGRDKQNLERLATYLSENYHLLSLNKIGDSEWQLHIEGTEVLSPEKLHDKNLEFNLLAAEYQIEQYDGWDVERL